MKYANFFFLFLINSVRKYLTSKNVYNNTSKVFLFIKCKKFDICFYFATSQINCNLYPQQAVRVYNIMSLALMCFANLREI